MRLWTEYNAGMYSCKTDYLRYEDIKHKVYSNKQNKKCRHYSTQVAEKTPKLMRLFRKYGIDKTLIEAYNDDKVLCGVSAGGICWCDWGNSDSEIISLGNDRMNDSKKRARFDTYFIRTSYCDTAQ